MQHSADIVIAGGGVIGWSCAWRLARTGRSVTLVDPGGHTAARYAAGILFPNGESRAQGALGELNRAAIGIWPSWADQLGVPLRSECGLIQVADGPESAAQLERWKGIFGAQAEWLSPADVAERVPGVAADLLEAALYLPGAAAVNPLDLLDALRLRARAAGVRELRGRAAGIVLATDRVRGLRLAGGEVVACAVVIAACGLDAGWLPQGQRPRIRPQMGERVIVRIPEPLSQPVLGTPGGSIVPRPTNELWAGVTVRDGDGVAQATAGGGAHVLSNLVRWLPRMSAARIVDLGAGLRPLSCDGLPFVGAAGLEGLYLAGGHGRDGILQSPLAAELIAGLLEDGRASGLERLAAHCAPTGRLA